MSSSLVYGNEKPLFTIVAALSALFWLALVGGTLGIVLLYVPFVFLAYCFAQSGFIAYVRGTAVELGSDQMPELHRQFLDCCDRLGVAKPPRVFVLNAGGLMNALATRFLRQHYVILFSDIVDGLVDHPAALDFYIGHEIGHIKRGHLAWGWFVGPGMIMPIIGAAYSRAREYTCDLHGLACCDDPKDAAVAIGLLAAGDQGWKTLNINRYAKQSDDATGFWMSFHELTGDYPWLTKRMKHVMAAAGGKPALFPGRSPLAYLFALFVPRIGGGAGGGLASMMALVAIIGILAAIAIPNFIRFQQRAMVSGVRQVRDTVQAKSGEHIAETGYLPGSLADLGMPEGFSTKGVESIEIVENGLVLHLSEKLDSAGEPAVLELTPYMEDGELKWRCEGNFVEALVAEACSHAPIRAPSAGLGDVLAKAMGGGGSTAGNEASSPVKELRPSAETCSSDFRDGPVFSQLPKVTREEHRAACNLWKLEQL